METFVRNYHQDFVEYNPGVTFSFPELNKGHYVNGKLSVRNRFNFADDSNKFVVNGLRRLL